MKTFEEYTTVDVSQLGDNWSAEYHINKKKGLKPYIKQNGFLVEVSPSKISQLKISWLSPDKVEEYNKVSNQIKELQEIQDNILI